MAGKRFSFKKRMLFILFSYFMLLILLVGRFGWLQIVKGDKYKSEAFLHQTRNTTISPRRGNIYDRNGKELAVSVLVYTISVSPETIKNSKQDPEIIASKLSEVLGKDRDEILKKLKKEKSKYELIEKKVDKDKSDKIRDWIKEKEISGVYLEEDSKRFYTGGNLAAHVIGFTNSDNEGIYGVERAMNEYLKGKPGKILSEVDTIGYEVPFGQGKRVDAEDGANVVLTIDETIQYITEKVLDKAIEEHKVKNGGAAIVMDPRTGEILAMVSKPDFDLNTPFGAPPGVDQKTWKGTTEKEVEILRSTVWRNKSIVDTYEPGSTFKTITSAMGLEEGIINPDSPVNDFTIKMDGWDINCHEPNKHGYETFKEGLYHSCNPVFTTLSLQLGLDRFYKYVRAFGFYDKTGIELPDEVKGNFHPKPTKLDMAVGAFGQRFEITPIELMQAYGAIANGGKLIKPHVVKEITDSEGNIIKRTEPEVVRNVISKQTSDTLLKMLEGVVSSPGGTGGSAYVVGYRVAGKTATAETRDKDKYTASFAAIAPVDNPSICVMVILFTPEGVSHGGGYTAGPAVAQIIEETLSYMGVEKKYTEQDKKYLEQYVWVPDVTNTDIDQALSILRERKLEYIKQDNGNTSNTRVMVQSPKPGQKVRAGSTVVLYTYKPDKEITVKVPDLKGKDIYEATQSLNNIGLNIRIKGMGLAVGQSVEKGKEVPKGSVVEVEFKQEGADTQ